MEEFRAIELQRARDFSSKINATFEFIRQNFRALGKSILFIAGPPVLVGSIIAGSFMGEFMNLGQTMQTDPDRLSSYFLSASFWLQLMLMFIFLLVSFVVAIATINGYIKLYDERRTNKIEVSEVWSRVQTMFWSYLGTSFLFFAMFIIVYIVMIIPVALLSAASGFFIFFGVLFIIVGLVYLMISTSLTYFVQTYESKNFIDAVMRSFRLVNQGKFWSTFGIIAVLYIIMMIISYIFIIPYYVVLFTNTLHSVSTGTAVEPSEGFKTWTIIFFTLYYMAQMFLYALPNVGIAFQYFNLVELKESRGLMEKINSMGSSDSTAGNRPEEHY